MKQIVWTRIDDRLIHGQVMTQWIQHASANEVVIVDDGLKILNTQDAIEYLNGEDNGKKEFILVKTPQALVALTDAGIKLDFVNVGGIGAKAGRKTLYKNISTSEAENKDLRNLIDKNIKVFFRVVVSDSEEDVAKYV